MEHGSRRGKGENLEGMEILQLTHMEICEYHSLPDCEGKPTEVHIVLRPYEESNTVLVVRLKSLRAVTELVDALNKHAANVWPAN